MLSPTPDIYGASHVIYGNEPMMMGSPGSPSSPHSGHQSQYLPGYLLGDSFSHNMTSGSRMWSAGGQSPTKMGMRGLSSPTGLGQGTPRTEMLRGRERNGAPPVKSLQMHSTSPLHTQSPYGPLSQQLSRSTHGSGTPAPPTIGLSHSMMGTPGPDISTLSTSRVPTSPAQMDPFYTQGDGLGSEDVLDEMWVTVFGFPPSAASFILQQFSQYGFITKHVMASEGNWMHMHYQSKLQAKKALSKNGKVYGGSIMVGVTPCIDMSVMEDDKENGGMLQNGTIGLSTPSNTSLHGTMGAGGGTAGTPIRPLTAAYMAAKNETEVVRSTQTPKKNNSVVTKAMEYVFGWRNVPETEVLNQGSLQRSQPHIEVEGMFLTEVSNHGSLQRNQPHIEVGETFLTQRSSTKEVCIGVNLIFHIEVGETFLTQTFPTNEVCIGVNLILR
ncbi:hypothetical protein ScPMuIL_015136 [Solemya velum]